MERYLYVQFSLCIYAPIIFKFLSFIMISKIKTLFRTIINESDILKSIRKIGFVTMSRQRRSFSAKFNSDLVIEPIKGEKDFNTLAAENNIQPNPLRNWKKSSLTMLPLCSMTSVRKTSKKNLPKNGKRKRRMPRRSFS